MNKKFVGALLLSLSCLICSLSATTVEIREAAFFPASHRFRHIYGNVGSQTEIEASTSWNCTYDVWANFSWFSKKNRNKPVVYGYSDSYDYSGDKLKSRIYLPNVSAGLKYTFPFSSFRSDVKFYAGLGIIVGKVDLHNRTDFMHEKTSKVAVGGIIKTGFNYLITNCFFIDIFVDYIYQPVRFHHKHVNVGGLKVGGGLGMKF